MVWQIKATGSTRLFISSGPIRVHVKATWLLKKLPKYPDQGRNSRTESQGSEQLEVMFALPAHFAWC